MANTLILMEGYEDVEALKDTSLFFDDVKIISFDFLAHKLLKQLKITHEIVEDYFYDNDKSEIDNQAVELTTTWHKHDDLIKSLEYNGLNIGNLLEIEMIGYFFLTLKRVLGIIRVIEKEKPERIICSSLGNFVSVICNHGKIETVIHTTKIRPSLHFDTIEVPIAIGGKIISIKISRRHFLQFKKISEIIFNIFFNFKPDLQTINNEKSILLLDFNPVLYPDLLKELSFISKNIILLNQRRPAIWNLESLQIVKNSKCKIIQLDNFATHETLCKIKKEQKDFENILSSTWSQEQILNEIFSIDGNSFWIAIKDNLIDIISKRSAEIIERFLLIEKLFENIKVNQILEWAHMGSEEKLVIFLANKRKIPIIFLQHGLYILNEKFEKYNTLLPLLPSSDAKEAVWGNIMKDYILRHKINSNEVLVTGSPRHDAFFKKSSTRNDGTILIATSGFFHNNFDGTNTRAFELLEDYIKKICQIVKKHSDKKLVVKLHPEKAYYDIRPLIHEIDPSIPIYQNQNIIDLIKSCDAMISLNYSTVLLDAMILNKPSMVILPERQNFEDEIPLQRKAVLFVSDIKDLEKSLTDLISNTNVREELIKKGKEFVDDYLINQGKSSEYLSRILDN